MTLMHSDEAALAPLVQLREPQHLCNFVSHDPRPRGFGGLGELTGYGDGLDRVILHLLEAKAHDRASVVWQAEEPGAPQTEQASHA